MFSMLLALLVSLSLGHSIHPLDVQSGNPTGMSAQDVQSGNPTG